MENDDDDFDKLLDKVTASSSGQQNAKKGRRATKAQDERSSVKAAGDEGHEAEEVDVYNLFQSSKTQGDGVGPKPSRRGGWGVDNVEPGKSSGGDLDARLQSKTPPLNDNDSDSDIPVIPMIGDADPDFSSSGADVVMAPQVAVNRVATYKELDSDLIKHTGFLSLDNEIDLKLLSKALSAEADIREEDVPWEWDHLFTEVSSELLSEWEKQANPETV
jgi:intraflagellar transport protein 43